MSGCYDGLKSFLNLEDPCLVRGVDDIGYPSLLHAMLGVFILTKTEKEMIAEDIFSIQSIKEQLKSHTKWSSNEADAIIRLFIQKYNNYVNELLCYVKEDEVVIFDYDPYNIFNKILHMLRQGRSSADICRELDWIIEQ